MRRLSSSMAVRHNTRPRDPFALDFPDRLRALARALTRRCPNCGGGPLFRRWLLMEERCPKCRLRLDRGEDDYFLGAFVVNFVAAELLICAGALIGIVATWPDVPWTGLKWTLMALVVPLPALTYPYARTLWLALDLTFRPLSPGDLEEEGDDEVRGGSGG